MRGNFWGGGMGEKPGIGGTEPPIVKQALGFSRPSSGLILLFVYSFTNSLRKFIYSSSTRRILGLRKKSFIFELAMILFVNSIFA